MTRMDVNRAGEMEVFVRVVDTGSFSAAARALQLTPSAVSKLVRRLEARLGVRLVNRSTRQVQLTPEGCVFYERSVRVLADLDEAERSAAGADSPRGNLRVSANVPFAEHFLLPLVPEFLTRYPDITLDLHATDEVIDLLDQRTDVALRAGPLKSSGLLARKLGQTRMVIVGTPDYLAKRGTPQTPADLVGHNLLQLSYMRINAGWPVVEQGAKRVIQPVGNVTVGDGASLFRLTRAGVGLARVAEVFVRDDIAAGRLRVVLEDYNPGDVETVHAVFLGQGGHLPARVRALLDFLVEHVHFDQVGR